MKSALARAFINRKSIKARDVLLGIIKVPSGSLVIWGKGTTIYGHIGFTDGIWYKKGKTVEGNTSSNNKGSQSNGDCVANKNRTIQPYNYFRITHFTVIE